MDSPKLAVRCNIDFLPDENEYDVVIALRHEEGRWYDCRERRFTSLPDACAWVEQTYPGMVAAWQAARQPAPPPEAVAEAQRPPGSTVVFVPSWLPEGDVRNLLKAQMELLKDDQKTKARAGRRR
ncbi:MAG: hypothetical protein L0332_18015 [Chloroflexi bacterium]|nr:hypothetical protein [Chloroflexota bacterium]MCI0728597.1 hypothetical protein [Chloroflexota bacterium]